MFLVTAFYKFVPVNPELIPSMKESLVAKAQELQIRGLVLLSDEGINGTIAGPHEGILSYKEFLRSFSGCSELEFKDSQSEKSPFRRFTVDLRKEIVALKRDVPMPAPSPSHLSPSQWQEVLEKEKDDIVLIDTRNDYEYAVGTFKGAIDPKIKKFSDFPKYLDEHPLPKEKKVLMFCTGGIRCEKAYLEMKQRGYPEVYQLEGGILKYLEQYPRKDFEGECFVFDHRVAVDQDLQPSKRFKLCVHCGDPADASPLTCKRCNKEGIVCEKCREKDASLHACSKDCAYHLKAGSKKKPRVVRPRNAPPPQKTI